MQANGYYVIGTTVCERSATVPRFRRLDGEYGTMEAEHTNAPAPLATVEGVTPEVSPMQAKSNMVQCVCEQCGAAFEKYPCRIKAGRGKYCSPACRNSARALPIEERFWSKVAKSEDGCWEWQGRPDKDGYGHIGAIDGREVKAHRLSYEMAYGPIPEGMLVCHSCDNPPCVRPDHLFLGTSQQNTADMIAKGRMSLPGAKITAETVRAIRDRYAMGNVTMRVLAEEFGVSTPGICLIVNRVTWKAVT